ncbi:MAG: GMP synthase subunit A [Methanomicrobiales archaeon]|nr:GMP synthase subunit A [Methanomicrobiales archaeon]
MQPLFVVNNYGQFNHLILRTLRDMDLGAVMVKNDTEPVKIEGGGRGLIIGGGPSMEVAGRSAEYLELGLPVLGICLGLQIIAVANGGSVRRGRAGGYGMVDIDISEHDEILQGYPERIRVWASHADEVTDLPSDFTILAHSDICEIEAVALKNSNIYGVQWHPEVSHTENGRLLFENFDRICRN